MNRLTLLHILLFTFLLICPTAVQAAGPFIVVIDAGHGGGDVGTPHRKGKQDEKVIALNVSLRLGELIKQKYPDVNVVYTRTTDVYPTLPDRTRKARESKGNLFISIHVNAAQDGNAHGVETYVFGITGLKGKSEAEQKRIRERTMIERENLDIDGKQIDFETAVDIETKILCQAQREKHNKYSQEVARYVQNSIMSDLRKTDYRNHAHDRGVKQKNIFVLCYSPMPAILVELGYMSNATEEKFMNTPEAQELYANAIFKGFEQYKRNWERRQLRDEDPIDILPLNKEIKEDIAEEVKPITETKPGTPTPPMVDSIGGVQKADIQPSAPETAPDKQETTVASTKQEELKTTKQEEVKQIKQEEVKTTYQTETQPIKPTEDPVGTPAPQVEQKDCFRIQFLSSSTHLKRGDAALKGLWPVQCYQINGLYRYTYGEATDKANLQNTILQVRKKFPDAFVVHFDSNGQRTR